MKKIPGKWYANLFFGLFLLVTVWATGGSVPAFAGNHFTLGVLAFRPLPETQEKWQPLADYLNETVAELNLELRVHDYQELEKAIAAGEIDFVLSNPAHYVMLAQRDQLSSPLASLINKVQERPIRDFGGVILVPSERHELNEAKDLKNLTIATVGTMSLGGFQVQAFELRQQGVDVFQEVTLMKTGMPHDAAIEAMLGGQADAAFVRSGVMEAMVNEGRLNAAAVRVFNQPSQSDFPFALSTRLYPEWPFAALGHTDEQMALRVASAIFDLPHNGEIANQLGIYGFTVPADYRPVERLLRDLRLPPFDQSPAFTVRDAWERWQSQFLFALLAVLLLLLLISAMVRGRRRVEQEQAYTLKLLASLGEGVYGSDRNGRCIFINDVAQTLLGYTAEEVIGHNQHQLFHHHTPDGRDYPETNCPICLTTHDGRGRRLEEWFFRKDGSGFPVELVVTPLREKGEIKGAIVAFQDISQRKEAEQLAARQSEELARSNADLEQFAYAISHDLRQPLRMVNGYLQLLERRMADRLVEKEPEFMFYATNGARRMDEMIVALLNFSRVGRKSEPMMAMNGRDSLDEALNFLGLDIEQAGATIKVDGHWPEVVASRDELTRLFQNLIGNAIKYVPADISPEVVVDSAMANDRWRVEIRDNGIGIDQGQQSRLFKVFSRLQLRQHFDGTGIGLALCRRIVEHHHGTIGVESAGEGQGSTFWFEMPVNRTQD